MIDAENMNELDTWRTIGRKRLAALENDFPPSMKCLKASKRLRAKLVWRPGFELESHGHVTKTVTIP